MNPAQKTKMQVIFANRLRLRCLDRLCQVWGGSNKASFSLVSERRVESVLPSSGGSWEGQRGEGVHQGQGRQQGKLRNATPRQQSRVCHAPATLVPCRQGGSGVHLTVSRHGRIVGRFGDDVFGRRVAARLQRMESSFWRHRPNACGRPRHPDGRSDRSATRFHCQASNVKETWRPQRSHGRVTSAHCFGGSVDGAGGWWRLGDAWSTGIHPVSCRCWDIDRSGMCVDRWSRSGGDVGWTSAASAAWGGACWRFDSRFAPGRRGQPDADDEGPHAGRASVDPLGRGCWVGGGMDRRTSFVAVERDRRAGETSGDGPRRSGRVVSGDRVAGAIGQVSAGNCRVARGSEGVGRNPNMAGFPDPSGNGRVGHPAFPTLLKP